MKKTHQIDMAGEHHSVSISIPDQDITPPETLEEFDPNRLAIRDATRAFQKYEKELINQA